RVLFRSPEGAEQVRRALGERSWRACVLTPRALSDMSGAYRLADGALENAPSHAYDTHGLLDEADACVLALLNNGPTTPEEVRRAVLGPLLLEDNAHLLHTVRAYFRTNATTAARETHHP